MGSDEIVIKRALGLEFGARHFRRTPEAQSSNAPAMSRRVRGERMRLWRAAHALREGRIKEAEYALVAVDAFIRISLVRPDRHRTYMRDRAVDVLDLLVEMPIAFTGTVFGVGEIHEEVATWGPYMNAGTVLVNHLALDGLGAQVNYPQIFWHDRMTAQLRNVDRRIGRLRWLYAIEEQLSATNKSFPTLNRLLIAVGGAGVGSIVTWFMGRQ